MTVKELREKLAAMPEDHVVLVKDGDHGRYAEDWGQVWQVVSCPKGSESDTLEAML